MQRRLGNDTGSVHSNEADAPLSPDVDDNTSETTLVGASIEDVFPSLHAPARLIRASKELGQLPQLLTVLPVFLSATQSVLGVFAADALLMKCDVPQLLHDAIADMHKDLATRTQRLSEAVRPVERDILRAIAPAERILETLLLLHTASQAFHESLASKDLPELPDDATDGPDTPSSASSSTSHRRLSRHTLMQRRRAVLSTISIISSSLDLPPTPTEEEPSTPFEFQLSRLYDRSDPANPGVVVEMPLPKLAMQLDSQGQLQAASLSTMLLLLTSYQSLGFEENLVETFFLSFRLFSSPDALMDIFEARWNEETPSCADQELTSSQRRVWARRLTAVRRCLVELVIIWLEGFWRHEKDEHLAPRLRAFIQRFPEDNTEDALEALKTALEHGAKGAAIRFKRAKEALATRDIPDVSSPALYVLNGCDFTIDKLANPEGIAMLAEQMAWLSHSMYRKIDPEDLVRMWAGEGPSFCELQHFEETTLCWVVYTIIMEEERSKRVGMMEFWLAVATASVDLRNFSAASAIFGGLVYASIERLWKTILELSIKSKYQYRALDTLLNGFNNYAVYRRAVAAYDLPTVPIMAVLRKDVISSKQLIGMVPRGDEPVEDRLIHLNAFRKLNTVVQFMESCFVKYTIEPDMGHQRLITHWTKYWLPESIEMMPTKTDEFSRALEGPPPPFVRKGRTWLQTVQGSVDDPNANFTVHDLPDPGASNGPHSPTSSRRRMFSLPKVLSVSIRSP
uniref:Cell division control protein Cdc25 n=1 Tax=Mycena chlorophos TaxID=658473 RepID=A0ABQ0LQT1_MYCCL|nr:cell division control protein Cdc25 [Mycena chlorophos]